MKRFTFIGFAWGILFSASALGAQPCNPASDGPHGGKDVGLNAPDDVSLCLNQSAVRKEKKGTKVSTGTTTGTSTATSTATSTTTSTSTSTATDWDLKFTLKSVSGNGGVLGVSGKAVKGKEGDVNFKKDQPFSAGPYNLVPIVVNSANSSARFKFTSSLKSSGNGEPVRVAVGMEMKTYEECLQKVGAADAVPPYFAEWRGSSQNSSESNGETSTSTSTSTATSEADVQKYCRRLFPEVTSLNSSASNTSTSTSTGSSTNTSTSSETGSSTSTDTGTSTSSTTVTMGAVTTSTSSSTATATAADPILVKFGVEFTDAANCLQKVEQCDRIPPKDPPWAASGANAYCDQLFSQ